jgi:hypothetical protein
VRVKPSHGSVHLFLKVFGNDIEYVRHDVTLTEISRVGQTAHFSNNQPGTSTMYYLGCDPQSR